MIPADLILFPQCQYEVSRTNGNGVSQGHRIKIDEIIITSDLTKSTLAAKDCRERILASHGGPTHGVYAGAIVSEPLHGCR